MYRNTSSSTASSKAPSARVSKKLRELNAHAMCCEHSTVGDVIGSQRRLAPNRRSETETAASALPVKAGSAHAQRKLDVDRV